MSEEVCSKGLKGPLPLFNDVDFRYYLWFGGAGALAPAAWFTYNMGRVPRDGCLRAWCSADHVIRAMHAPVAYFALGLSADVRVVTYLAFNCFRDRYPSPGGGS
jgi:hypothetical protein